MDTQIKAESTQEKSQEELLRELLAYQKKEVRHSRIVTAANILLAAAIALPRFVALTGHVEQSLSRVDALVQDAQALIEDTDALVADNSQAVTETVQKLNEIDLEQLNKAIEDLNDVVEPLANFFRRFQ